MFNFKLNNPTILTMFTCADLSDEELAVVRKIKAKELYIRNDGGADERFNGRFETELSADVLYGSKAIIEYMKALGYDEVPGCITEIAVDEILSLAESWEQLKDFVFFIDRIKAQNECVRTLEKAFDATQSSTEVMMKETDLLNETVEDLWFGGKNFLRDDGKTKRTCLMDL